MFLLGLSRVGRRHCARVAAEQRRRSVVIIAASLSSVSKLATQDFVNFLCGNPWVVRRRCAWAAALVLLRCMAFSVGGPLQGSSQDTRHSLAVAKMFGFFSSCKAVCTIACSVLPSLHDALDACFSQNFQVLFLSAPLNDASRWFFCKKKKAKNSTFDGSTFTVEGRSFSLS